MDWGPVQPLVSSQASGADPFLRAGGLASLPSSTATDRLPRLPRLHVLGLLAALPAFLLPGFASASSPAQRTSQTSQPLALAPTTVSPGDAAFFESRIRPLLIEHCHECHSVEGGKTKGGLTLDSPEGILQGGETGPLLERGNPEASRLIEAVRYKNPDFQMPPKNPLSAAQVGDLERWVRMGAPDPRPMGARGVPKSEGLVPPGVEEGRSFWAFTKPKKPPVPRGSARGEGAAPHPVDAFLEEPLKQKGLKPAPPAERRTLLRRVTFDLTGLPPTQAELEAFLSDTSPQAYEKVVARLLDSPAYGERWGRHWLDVARYADSNGLDENVAFGNAWRYRDYVVDSFNKDKPYDRFVREQIAGDLLPAGSPAERREQLSALGFLSIGPKLLAEVDKVKLEMDLIDEQIDTLGKAFLGMTLGCARCHSHKFDPIPTEDYYALAAIFKSTRTMDDLKTIAKWHEPPVATPSEQALHDAHQRRVALQRARVEEILANANEDLFESKELLQLPPKPEALYPPETTALLKTARAALTQLEKEAPELPSTMGVTDKDAITAALSVHVRGSHLNLGRPVARGFLQVMLPPGAAPQLPAAQSGRRELAEWLASPDHPLTSRVMVNRIWRWHFGRGLVATPDNFGTLGDAPSHPALLDWLACRFIEEGWSIKAMHQLLLHSEAYRRSAAPVDPALQAAADPENRLLSHFPTRRLEAEEIRDALLAVAGTLDRAMGGKTIPLKNREFVFNHTSKDATTYESTRRALYLPVIRNNVYDFFEQFDFPDPAVSNGNRATTVVASQALLLQNSELVHSAARSMARSLLSEPGDAAARVGRAHLRAYARAPHPNELRRALDFLARTDLASPPASEERWSALCQILFATNEFIHLH